MGREAYLMRLALGRSALDPPEDSQTFTAARAGEWTSAVHDPAESPPSEEAIANARSQPPPQNVQLYDAGGHPFNTWARTRARKLRDAQNDILSVIGITERKIPADRGFGHGGFDHRAPGHAVDPDEDLAGGYVGNAADFDYQFLSWWIHALTNRLLVLPPVGDKSFSDIVLLHWRTLGWRDFMFAGLPSFMLSHVVNPEMWTSFILYFLDRAVIAHVSSRERREAYERARFGIAGVIEVVMNLFVLPFRLQSTLQLFGFAPSSTWFGLPHPRSWLPFYGSSLIRWSWDTQPLLPFFVFRPLSSLVHQYLFMSCRPAIMGPVDAADRRQSTGSRFTPSINAAPLLDLPNEETALTLVFQRVFDFLNWGHPSYVSEKPDMPFHLGLRRRETWPVDHSVGVRPDTPAPDAEGTAPEAGAGAEVEGDAEIPLLLQRVQTATTFDNSSPIERGQDDTSDATIRVSSIDPDTGAVNLEIGLPEEALFEHETAIGLPEEGDGEGSAGASATRRRQELELFQKPHHVSRLALEPTELLASLVNGWVAGWLLMPLRAMVLRGLVRYVTRKPELFGVDATRAGVLPRLLGSDMSVLAPGASTTRGVKHVALSSLIDVSLGLSFWLVEWAVVRSIGIGAFNWGTF